MDNKTIRLINLRKLLKESRTAASLAFAANTSPAYLSQILSSRSKGRIGDKLARKLEEAAKKPSGWLDFIHDAQNDPAVKNTVILDVKKVIQWCADETQNCKKITESNIDPSDIVPGKIFCVEMQGNAMMSQLNIAASICPGDIMLMQPNNTAELGDTLLVKINHSIKIRQLTKDGNELILKPLNPQYPIIPFTDNMQILGVVLEIRRELRAQKNQG